MPTRRGPRQSRPETRARQSVVAALITRLRLNAGLTQQRLADLVVEYGQRASRSAVSNWEAGLSEPSASQLVAILVVTQTERSGDPMQDKIAELERLLLQGIRGIPQG